MAVDYIINRLTDISRMDEVYRLTHDSLVAVGDILPRADGKIISYPHLDTIPQTTIIIAEKNQHIVGTVSLTLDGSQGLYTDVYFKAETDHVRAHFNGNLCATWRIATTQEYRYNRRLVLELIKETFRTAQEKGYDLCLFVFNQKHVKVYQRIIGATVLASKTASVDNNVKLPLVLMQMEVSSGWERFKNII